MNRLITFTLLAALVTVTATAMGSHDLPTVDTNSCSLPQAPTDAVKSAEACTVTVSVLVSAAGKVLEHHVEKSSGHEGLDKAAIEGLSACKFKPGMKGGQAASMWTKVEINWPLA